MNSSDILVTCILHMVLLLETYSSSAISFLKYVLVSPSKTSYDFKKRNYRYCTSLANERASLAPATRVVIHYIFTLGPSALGIEKSYY